MRWSAGTAHRSPAAATHGPPRAPAAAAAGTPLDCAGIRVLGGPEELMAARGRAEAFERRSADHLARSAERHHEMLVRHGLETAPS